MIVYPNAKINLGLNILNKRNDGFHNISSVFFPVKSCYDILEVKESKSLCFKVTGKFKINEFPLDPAVCLLNIAFFEYFKDSILIYSPNPGYSLSITSRVASGVTSLDDGPVPPVVIIT